MNLKETVSISNDLMALSDAELAARLSQNESNLEHYRDKLVSTNKFTLNYKDEDVLYIYIGRFSILKFDKQKERLLKSFIQYAEEYTKLIVQVISVRKSEAA